LQPAAADFESSYAIRDPSPGKRDGQGDTLILLGKPAEDGLRSITGIERAIMTARDLGSRNLWIIAALVLLTVVLLTVVLLAWFLTSGGEAAGTDIADVSVEAPPETSAASDRNDPDPAGSVSDTLAPPSPGATVGGK